MQLFKKKESRIWEEVVALMADTVDDIMGKVVDLYTGDEVLADRATEGKLLDISMESMMFLAHLLDLQLFRKRPDIRESIMRSIYNVFSGAYDVEDASSIIDDRMDRYGMIARGVWQPAAYWWFGKEMKQHPLVQSLALFGDYITYYRIYGNIPTGDDIEPVILVDALDCETLAVPFVVFQILSPAVNQYIDQLQEIVH